MDRKEIKTKAKEFAFHNKWNVWKIELLYAAAACVVSLVLGLIPGQKTCSTSGLLKTCTLTTFGEIISLISSFIYVIFGMVMIAYLLELVRTGVAPDVKKCIESAKRVFPMYFGVIILVALNIIIGSLLLIIPGIIASFGLMFVSFVAYENPTLSIKEVMRKTWDLMNGYKWNYFVFCLSFIGWGLLIGITLGIASIWALPFITVAYIMYYDKLKEIKNM